MPTSHQIIVNLIFIGIGILLYLAITWCVNEYRWWRLKHHVLEAIKALELWDAIKEPVTRDLFQSITTYLDEHKYRHCFHEPGGAFFLACALTEIRAKL